jgi:hypothetical protein
MAAALFEWLKPTLARWLPGLPEAWATNLQTYARLFNALCSSVHIGMPQAEFTTSLEQLVDGKVALENTVTAILEILDLADGIEAWQVELFRGRTSAPGRIWHSLRRASSWNTVPKVPPNLPK